MNDKNKQVSPSRNRNKKTSNWNDVNSNSEAGIFLNSKFLDKF